MNKKTQMKSLLDLFDAEKKTLKKVAEQIEKSIEIDLSDD